MADSPHSTLTGAELHDVKGAAAAADGQYLSVSSSASTWVTPDFISDAPSDSTSYVRANAAWFRLPANPFIFSYKADTTTNLPTGSTAGKVIWSTAAQNDSTEITIHNVSDNSVDRRLVMEQTQVGQIVYLTSITDPSKYQAFLVSQITTTEPDYITLTGTMTWAVGTAISNDDSISVTFSQVLTNSDATLTGNGSEGDPLSVVFPVREHAHGCLEGNAVATSVTTGLFRELEVSFDLHEATPGWALAKGIEYAVEDNTFVYTGTETKVFCITANISMTKSGGGSDEYSYQVFQNDVDPVSCPQLSSSTSSTVSAVSITVAHDFSTNDTVTVKVSRLTGMDDITPSDVSLVIFEI
jgi:hypothetical protein